jgi:hypothetical protein
MSLDSHSIAARLKALHESLVRFDASVPCPWELGEIFNLLLDEAKGVAADDPVVGIIKPATPGPDSIYVREDSGALAGKTLQLWRALSAD